MLFEESAGYLVDLEDGVADVVQGDAAVLVPVQDLKRLCRFVRLQEVVQVLLHDVVPASRQWLCR